jgi:hypothetical protein
MATVIEITLDEVLTKVRTFLLSIVPAGTPVLRGPVNRVAQPAVPHVIFTPIMRNRLRTNVHEDNSVTQQTTIEEGAKVTVQFDFYGENAGDWSSSAETLWRDEYACDILSPEAQPLYTDTANMVPLVTGEDQFLERFVLTATLQWNVRVTVTQQSANVLSYDLINVDERFPPV